MIYSCGCSATDEFAKSAFSLLFPNVPLPPIAKANSDNPDPRIKALAKSHEPYAFYQSETELWDLLKGVRVA